MRARRMTIFVGEGDRWHHQPLYLAILHHLKKAGCSGATVTRGIAGFGAHSYIKTARILELSVDLPVVITAVDVPERIERVLPELVAMLAGGTITIDDTEVRFSSAAFKGGLPDVEVGELMSNEPESVGADTPIADVVERLVERDYTALPVVDAERRVIGIVSDGDMLGAGLTQLSLSLHKAIGPELVREYLAQLKQEGRTVRQAMSQSPVTVRPETRAREAAHLMHVHRLKRLPVVDEEGRLVGVLGRLDILQSIVSGHARRMAPHAPLPQEHRTVGEIMDRHVPSVPETAALVDVVELLLTSDVKRVLVLGEDGRPLGIVTDSDIVARIDPEERPGMLTLLRSRWSEVAKRQVRRSYGQRAADVMTSPVITVDEGTSVMNALALTVTRHVKRLPVVGSDGRVVGMVSRPALLAASLDLARVEEG